MTSLIKFYFPHTCSLRGQVSIMTNFRFINFKVYKTNKIKIYLEIFLIIGERNDDEVTVIKCLKKKNVIKRKI